MTDKIKSKLDEYLEFDSSLLFKSDDFEKIRVKRLIRIFGGIDKRHNSRYANQ